MALKNHNGFTLIELVIIIVIIGILVAVAIFGYLDVKQQAADGIARAMLGGLRTQNTFIFSQRVIGGTNASYTMLDIANNMAELKGMNWTASSTRFSMTVGGIFYRFTLTPTPFPPTTVGIITAGTGGNPLTTW